jgi:hypothetical protein
MQSNPNTRQSAIHLMDGRGLPVALAILLVAPAVLHAQFGAGALPPEKCGCSIALKPYITPITLLRSIAFLYILS